jgi:hypothetical protein
MFSALKTGAYVKVEVKLEPFEVKFFFLLLHRLLETLPVDLKQLMGTVL